MNSQRTFSLPEDIINYLGKIAKATNCSESFIVSEALKMYFEDIDDFHLAKQRFNNDEEILSSEELRKRLRI